MPDLTRRAGAEAMGTALLLATVVGSGIMAERLTDDVALALLGNTIATGAMLVVLIEVFGPVSGAHFNPAVTLVMALRRDLTVQAALVYCAAQTGGAVLGVWLAHGMFETPIWQISGRIRTGPSQWLSEAVACFGLIVTILAVSHSRATAVPMAVGLYITAAYWFTASTSFANPAVTLARSLSDSFAGIRPSDVAPFVAAQLTGAVLALAYWRWQARP